MRLLDIADLGTEFRSAGGEWQRVLDGVDLHLDVGEILCLVGESGSGKSVTALSVLGLLPEGRSRHPTGAIRLHAPDGHALPLDLLRASAADMAMVRGGRIGMIFQEPMTSLNPVMTVGAQLDEVLRLHRRDLAARARADKVLQALADVWLPQPERLVQEFPHRLSGGQRQRVMIAMALLCEPALLIADEPTTALDVTVQAEILRLMRDLRERRGTAMLFITHDFGVVAQMADRVAVMRHGQVVEQGSVQQVLAQPAHPYTRGLIADLPENLPRGVRHGGAGETLAEARDLKVYFPRRGGLLRRVVDHVRAVDEVSLSVRGGEVLALVGESGSGKSTVGRALLRLLVPTGGTVAVLGTDVTHASRREMQPLRRVMQVVFQDPGSSLNPRLPIATTLVEPMRVHGLGADDEARFARAAELLQRVELPVDSLWRFPHEFSGGQRQRIALARALALQPRFIVCDEITSALDVTVQAGILRLLRELVDVDGLGLLFITHNIAVVRYLADRVAVMNKGRIVESGAAADVLDRPAHDYTRTLLAAVPHLFSGFKTPNQG